MADDEKKVKKDRDPIFWTCLIVFILAVCAVTGAMIYNDNFRTDSTAAVNGSSVSVDYIGTFYAPFGENNAVVFDTSKWSVANDDNVTKSNDFTGRGDQSAYTTLNFKIGDGTLLPGFNNAVIGMKVGETKRIVIPAGEGYTAPSTPQTVQMNGNTMPTTENLTQAQFSALYGFTPNASTITTLDKSVYGWPATATVNSTNGNSITMNYMPQPGSEYTAVDSDFGKVALKVTSVQNGQITFNYVISNTISNGSGIQLILVDFGTSKFYITALSGSSFTTQVVAERYNQDLYFEITLVSAK
ncbi:FKBP-type peptidyl-prolyl cis-trans isomerase [Candidatus Methanoplasma termitum]|uniref:Peptidyl-prolyl cis-trans isomerase n=1 Tax=Candidatus Methanoplasma termitum TaxID=1577791 RepID=A0A0A7LD42_9ARCH|nr:FKBP-type peptidyl-prolyl cis-trans isomerase [Candidatus Methanoplasma termitum]AIZ56212.1 FKBP-type peptidyl-prolyl cis-trans isomerase [Candidatus Methanoplasma termitum]MCL2334400.1 FKBP-type peptidyl-prolyl cis-trans isomerase [Candidatus Methanoplasma sp.]